MNKNTLDDIYQSFMVDVYRYLLSLCHNEYIAEAYISFDKFYKTDEILKKFEHRQVTPVWFAVDTGFENTDFIDEPIGFPYIPIWHSDDMTLNTKREKKDILFSKIVSENKSSPSVDSYGSGKLRNKNFRFLE